jgi:hypothetical protein
VRWGKENTEPIYAGQARVCLECSAYESVYLEESVAVMRQDMQGLNMKCLHFASHVQL